MFAFSAEPIDVALLTSQLARPEAGACITFEGWVRNHNQGQGVLRLEYEAYEPLAVKEGELILGEAMRKFNVCDAHCVHRVGSLEIGDTAVWVGVTAAHRDEAYRASRYIIDEIKARVPIWKKEHYARGDSGWVNCEQSGSATA
ncbi:MAG: molybdenum cofactor biosynthesis protein MoaE [Candidatus Hydrogenedentes bacterium]|nr:molybdenum cofactor biosynthesis protein MoaE [Candidatus Hydrogenedentota bacterium]